MRDSEHKINEDGQQLKHQMIVAKSEIEENTFDFLGSYQSDKDEDYSEKEDLIVNKKYYQKDLHRPF